MSSTISTSRFNSSRRSPWSDDPSFLGLHWDGYMEIIANGYMRSSLACEYDQVEALPWGRVYWRTSSVGTRSTELEGKQKVIYLH